MRPLKFLSVPSAPSAISAIKGDPHNVALCDLWCVRPSREIGVISRIPDFSVQEYHTFLSKK